MNEQEWLAHRFEAHRAGLRSMALRMLGSTAEADDAVQEAWLRAARADLGDVQNVGGWLTTATARIALDMLRGRATRREAPVDELSPERAGNGAHDPEPAAVTADAVGLALQVVLDTLRPAERLAFVLHDMFDVPFDEVGAVLGRSPAAAKQLAHRARWRVQGAPVAAVPDLDRRRHVLDAFLTASRSGNFEALLTVLDPDIVLHADDAGVRMGSPAKVRTAAAVAGVFSGRALGAEVAMVDGLPGLAWVVGGSPKVVWDFTVAEGRVVRIDMVAAPDSLPRWNSSSSTNEREVLATAQSVDASVPRTARVEQPTDGRCETFRRRSEADFATITFGGDETGSCQTLQVLHHRLTTDGQRLGEHRGGGRPFRQQPLQQLPTSGIGERAEQRVERVDPERFGAHARTSVHSDSASSNARMSHAAWSAPCARAEATSGRSTTSTRLPPSTSGTTWMHTSDTESGSSRSHQWNVTTRSWSTSTT